MYIIAVLSFIIALGVTHEHDHDGTACTMENAVLVTDQCEKVYTCKPFNGAFIWAGFACPEGSKPNDDATGCLEGKCKETAVTPPPEFKCQDHVPHGYLSGYTRDPTACNRYFYCYRGNEDNVWYWRVDECGKDHHWYPYLRKCLYGPCPDDVLPASPPPPGAEFKCQDYVPPNGYWGNVRDPDHCEKYYYCYFQWWDKTWKLDHYECRHGWHYNPFVAGCIEGPCPGSWD